MVNSKMKTFLLYVPMMLLSIDVFSAQLSSADEVAAFKTAGYRSDGKYWRSHCHELSPSSSGEITIVRDLNGDSLPEVLITEGSTYCYGNTGYHYSLVSKLNNSSWKLVTSGVGIPTFIATEDSHGWPDIEVAGTGFCFPVMRWNGRNYVFNRYQYDNVLCSPQ
ncbi:hypothetical protein KY858_001811 [Vibrio vulnificus]|nr:hypothetical protein [Vibrio vulnificus]EHU4795340.1 hypothetical protein [Vibrio vulnificus]EHU4931837.1 hypothetical protein [Vibrio vulnificus]EHZ2651777.1 hypothetical protein [Vibrio vulnificus]EIA1287960.1 hypothetical protein [Vibrio vulnificus]